MAKSTSGKLSIGEAINSMMKTLHLDEKLDKRKVVESWGKVMGAAVANRTTEIYFRDKKLFIHLQSASLREELFNARDKIKALLNEEAGSEVVEEIIFS